MGDKIEARRTAKRLGIPVVPGSECPVASSQETRSIADSIGFPVLVKAAAGGEAEASRLCKTRKNSRKPWQPHVPRPRLRLAKTRSTSKNIFPIPATLKFRCSAMGISAVYHGYSIPPYYDSLVGKLIVRGKNRGECLMRLRRALDKFVVDGIETTMPLFRALVREKDMIDGDYHIHWLEDFLQRGAMQG
jgi:biotin carboxylase